MPIRIQDFAVGATCAAPVHAVAPSEQAGQMIGRYKLPPPFGEGDFGRVWMTEHCKAARRSVAVKTIYLDIEAKQFISPF